VTLGVEVMYAQSGPLVWMPTRIQRVLYEAIPSSAASIPLPEIEGGCLQAPGHDELLTRTMADISHHQLGSAPHPPMQAIGPVWPCGLVDDLSP
jgi:hypothetical protein